MADTTMTAYDVIQAQAEEIAKLRVKVVSLEYRIATCHDSMAKLIEKLRGMSEANNE